MRKVLFAIAFFLFLLGVVSCKRDYPRNIPHWLKDKIKELKKEGKRKGGCGLGECMSIHEFSDGTNVFYVWRVGTEFPRGDIFMIMMGIFSVNNSTLIRVVAEALLICQLTIIPVIFGWSPITSHGNWIKCGRELSMEHSETKIDLDKLKYSIVL